MQTNKCIVRLYYCLIHTCLAKDLELKHTCLVKDLELNFFFLLATIGQWYVYIDFPGVIDGVILCILHV